MLSLNYVSGNNKISYVGPTVGSREMSTAIVDTNWHHIVCTVDETSNVLNFYIDGRLDSTQTTVGVLAANSAPLIFGIRTNYFNGLIDETKIYNYARSADEVRLDYQAGLATHIGPSGGTCDQNTASCLDSGMVGYWDMDDGAGTVAKDKTSNHNDATLYGNRNFVANPSFEIGVAGVTSANFSTTNSTGNSYVGSYALKASAAAGVGSGATVTYINTPSVSAVSGGIYSYSVSYKVVNSGGGNWTMYVTGRQIPAGSGSTTLIADGAWHQFTTTGTNDLGAGTEYIRTYLSSPSTLPSNAEIWFDAVQIEQANSSTSYCDGSLSSGRWEGTAHASVSVCNPPTWVSGKYGNALNLNSPINYLNCGHNSSLNVSNSTTISAWVKTTPNGNQSIVQKGNNGCIHPEWFYYDGDQLTLRSSIADPNYYIKSSVINLHDDAYHFVSVVATDGQSPKFYMDGVDVSNSTNIYHKAGSNSDSYDLIVGAARVSCSNPDLYSDQFIGNIDDLRIYNYARTASEITADYQAGVATHVWPNRETCDRDPAGCMNKGLVGYWDMDEGKGLVANDKSGNGNKGTLINGPRWVEGKNGGAVQFDGINDYFLTGNSPVFSVESVAIEAWVKVKNLTPRPSLVGNTSTGYWMFLGTNGSMYMYLNTNEGWHGAGTSATYTWTDGWHHIVQQYDSNTQTVKYYRDGVNVYTNTSGTTGKINSSLGGIRFGTENGNYFNGLLDDVRIYNRALSPEEVRYHYNQGGPVGWWKMDEGKGNKAGDASVNKNKGVLGDGTCQPGSGTCPSWVEGKFGSALSFDGSNDYVNCGNNNSLKVTQNYTVEAWLKTSTASVNGQKPVNKNLNFQILVASTFTRFWLYDGSWHAIEAPTSIIDGTWHHVVGVRNRTNTVSKLFIDGAEKATANDTWGDSTNAVNLIIGMREAGDNNGSFNGLIDDVKIYNYARTAEQIKVDYNDGVAAHLK